jgi:hypothetical protein
MNDELKTKLSELGLSEEQVGKLAAEGVTDDSGMTLLSGDDVKSITGCGLVTARKVAAAFVPQVEVSASAPSSEALDMILPSVPDDKSWVDALRAGGVLKIEESTVISAIRAALAYRAGLFDIPQKLVSAMEAYTDETEEQVGPEFFRMRKLLTRSEYGDLFAAIDGMDGNFVTKGRKEEMLRRIDGHLWSSIRSFNDQLQAWQQAWMQGAANPMAMMAMLAGGAGAMPPGMMSPPDTGALRDSAEAVNDNINRIFRGTGVQISAALAYEANRIKETLQTPNLPTLVGAPNREQMLKKLGVSVPATYPRLEQNLTKFVLGIIKASDQPAGDEELRYFGALFMLGSQIEWNLLDGMSGGSRKAGLGQGRRIRSQDGVEFGGEYGGMRPAD